MLQSSILHTVHQTTSFSPGSTRNRSGNARKQGARFLDRTKMLPRPNLALSLPVGCRARMTIYRDYSSLWTRECLQMHIQKGKPVIGPMNETSGAKKSPGPLFSCRCPHCMYSLSKALGITNSSFAIPSHATTQTEVRGRWVQVRRQAVLDDINSAEECEAT